MSQAMELIDEARAQRDQQANQAAQWQYIATLLFLQRGDATLQLPESARDIEGYTLAVTEGEGDEDGDLIIQLQGEPNA